MCGNPNGEAGNATGMAAPGDRSLPHSPERTEFRPGYARRWAPCDYCDPLQLCLIYEGTGGCLACVTFHSSSTGGGGHGGPECHWRRGP